MADIPATARVVIIGGGAVGVSALFHLARAGWRDCVLLEKNELTAGSTWHAAGNVPTFSTSWSLMNMQRYSTELYRGLGDAVGYPMNYHVTGSIRLAHSRERMQEFARARGMGRYQGMEIEVLAPEDIPARHPFVETHDLAGALYDPADGDIDPAQLTQALAKGARDMGAQIMRFTPATGISRAGDEWVVHTGKGDIRCEIVVNAAGYYAGAVGEWFRPFGGRPVPVVSMEHQYLVFEEVPEVRDWSARAGHKLPLLRDVESSYYLRQEKGGFNLGPYERDCRAHWVTPDQPFPDDFSFQLFPDDLDRLAPYIEDALARVPVLAQAGVARVINGPIPYTPDGNPLIGPMPGVRNAFNACVFSFGIAQAGGAGKVLAEWVTEGATEWDMWSCDPRRFGDHATRDYTLAKAREVYGHEYAMHFPMARWPAAPDQRVSAVHDRVKALGGQMAPYNGWERAEWFAAPGDDTGWDATQTWDRAGPWQPRIAAECAAVRDGTGVLDLPGFSRYRLKGAGAAAWLDGLCSGRLPKVGRIGLLYFADTRGRIVTEMSAMRLDEDFFFLITAAGARGHDFELLQAALPEAAGFTLDDVTEDFSTQIVTGPGARELLAPLTDADLSLPWLTHQSAQVAEHWAQLVRVSYAGELGWEVHSKVADTAPIYDAVLAAGAKPFGMRALDSLRIEKGYRAWKGDLSTDYTLLEGGLERFINWDKDFPGKPALLAERDRGPKKRFVTLKVEAGTSDAPYMSTIWHEGAVVGETTSGAWGYRVGASLALGYVRPDLAREGQRVEVEIYGERRPATVQADGPLWDPANARLKA
ncbi:MAG: GcvT family protein [Rubellimicrobium sp.]|nr:GcvT family protein [Rubellimicrobium sp.]